MEDEFELHMMKAQEALNERVRRQETISQYHGEQITALNQRLTELERYRDSAIKADLLNGMKGVDAAAKYNLSAARISQIKRSNRN